jgi:(p)ppGpp synthase/HD superfamily hydrolase
MNRNDLISRAREFADRRHGEQEYNGQRYIVHCDAVLEVATRFGYGNDIVIVPSCILHDTIEDTDVTRYELAQEFGEDVARTVWLVTDKGTGLPRKERHVLTYPLIRGDFNATVVKVSDRIANCEVGSKNDMYRKEYEYFKNTLYIPDQIDEMWEHLDWLLS